MIKPNDRIEYQIPLSLSSITSPASSRYCPELSFRWWDHVTRMPDKHIPKRLLTANFQTPYVIQVTVVSERDTKTSFVSVSEPMGRTGDRQIRLEDLCYNAVNQLEERRIDCKESSCNEESSLLCQHHHNNSNCIYLQHMWSWLFIPDRFIQSQQTPPLRFVVSTTQSRYDKTVVI